MPRRESDRGRPGHLRCFEVTDVFRQQWKGVPKAVGTHRLPTTTESLRDIGARQLSFGSYHYVLDAGHGYCIGILGTHPRRESPLMASRRRLRERVLAPANTLLPISWPAPPHGERHETACQQDTDGRLRTDSTVTLSIVNEFPGTSVEMSISSIPLALMYNRLIYRNSSHNVVSAGHWQVVAVP